MALDQVLIGRDSQRFALPSNREEGWRWSNVSALPALAEEAPSGRVPDALPWIDCDGPRLLFVDGTFVAERSDPREVRVGRSRFSTRDNPLAEYASWEARQGYVIPLGPDGATSGLVQIICVSTGGAAHYSNRIMLEPGAQASVVETHIGSGWSNTISDFHLRQGARLMRTLRVLKQGGAHTDYGWAEVRSGASYDMTALVMGCDSARIQNQVYVCPTGAYAEAGGALLAREAQKLEAATAVRHTGPGGTSRQLWRSVADDRSACSVAARVEVDRDAQKTDAEQSLKGLLLDRGAQINAKPELEIFADDVKCAHGATVGELDRNALFYLESRGVAPEEARALLTRAFVADALDRIGEEAVRAACYADVERWFGGSQ
jgi:Fe-S cluster assembly protein SufD